MKRGKPKGLEKFENAYLHVRTKEFDQWLKTGENSRLLREEVNKNLFDLGPATPPRGPEKRTGREEFFFKLSWAYREIVASAENLRDIEFYIGRFPYRNAPVTKHRYLQFHIEVFLHEIYILEMRLLSCLTMLERQYRKDPRLPVIQDLCNELRELVTKALKKLVDWRGSHVHQYRISDTNVDRLGGIFLYSLSKNRKIKQAFQAYYRSEYKKSRSGLKGWIANANKSITELLDVFFDGVHAITFSRNGTVRYPSRLNF